jgi:hypothetical protein
MIKEAQRADQKSATSKRSLHLAVSINIAAFITNENRPRVIKIAGRVSNLTIEPKIPFIRPKSDATQR